MEIILLKNCSPFWRLKSPITHTLKNKKNHENCFNEGDPSFLPPVRDFLGHGAVTTSLLGPAKDRGDQS